MHFSVILTGAVCLLFNGISTDDSMNVNDSSAVPTTVSLTAINNGTSSEWIPVQHSSKPRITKPNMMPQYRPYAKVAISTPQASIIPQLTSNIPTSDVTNPSANVPSTVNRNQLDADVSESPSNSMSTVLSTLPTSIEASFPSSTETMSMPFVVTAPATSMTAGFNHSPSEVASSLPTVFTQASSVSGTVGDTSSSPTSAATLSSTPGGTVMTPSIITASDVISPNVFIASSGFSFGKASASPVVSTSNNTSPSIFPTINTQTITLNAASSVDPASNSPTTNAPAIPTTPFWVPIPPRSSPSPLTVTPGLFPSNRDVSIVTSSTPFRPTGRWKVASTSTSPAGTTIPPTLSTVPFRHRFSIRTISPLSNMRTETVTAVTETTTTDFASSTPVNTATNAPIQPTTPFWVPIPPKTSQPSLTVTSTTPSFISVTTSPAPTSTASTNSISSLTSQSPAQTNTNLNTDAPVDQPMITSSPIVSLLQPQILSATTNPSDVASTVSVTTTTESVITSSARPLSFSPSSDNPMNDASSAIGPDQQVMTPSPTTSNPLDNVSTVSVTTLLPITESVITSNALSASSSPSSDNSVTTPNAPVSSDQPTVTSSPIVDLLRPQTTQPTVNLLNIVTTISPMTEPATTSTASPPSFGPNNNNIMTVPSSLMSPDQPVMTPSPVVALLQPQTPPPTVNPLNIVTTITPMAEPATTSTTSSPSFGPNNNNVVTVPSSPMGPDQQVMTPSPIVALLRPQASQTAANPLVSAATILSITDVGTTSNIPSASSIPSGDNPVTSASPSMSSDQLLMIPSPNAAVPQFQPFPFDSASKVSVTTALLIKEPVVASATPLPNIMTEIVTAVTEPPGHFTTLIPTPTPTAPVATATPLWIPLGRPPSPSLSFSPSSDKPMSAASSSVASANPNLAPNVSPSLIFVTLMNNPTPSVQTEPTQITTSTIVPNPVMNSFQSMGISNVPSSPIATLAPVALDSSPRPLDLPNTKSTPAPSSRPSLDSSLIMSPTAQNVSPNNVLMNTIFMQPGGIPANRPSNNLAQLQEPVVNAVNSQPPRPFPQLLGPFPTIPLTQMTTSPGRLPVHAVAPIDFQGPFRTLMPLPVGDGFFGPNRITLPPILAAMRQPTPPVDAWIPVNLAPMADPNPLPPGPRARSGISDQDQPASDSSPTAPSLIPIDNPMTTPIDQSWIPISGPAVNTTPNPPALPPVVFPIGNPVVVAQPTVAFSSPLVTSTAASVMTFTGQGDLSLPPAQTPAGTTP